MKKKICIITGSEGNIGKDISDFFLKKKWSIIKLSSSKKIDTYYYNLNEPEKSQQFIPYKADLLIHCAYEFNITDIKKNNKININGTLKTFKIANKKKIKKIINISSLSSFSESKSIYGKTKYQIEKKTKKFKVFNLRLGLYKSNKPCLYSRIKKLSKKFLIFPLVERGLYNLHICDKKTLTIFLYKIANNKIKYRNYFNISQKKPVTLKDLILKFSQKKIFIYLPLVFVKLTLNLLNVLNINIGFTTDNLKGLINYNKKIKFLNYS